MAKHFVLFCAALAASAQETFDCNLLETPEGNGEGSVALIQKYLEEAKDNAKFELE